MHFLKEIRQTLSIILEWDLISWSNSLCKLCVHAGAQAGELAGRLWPVMPGATPVSSQTQRGMIQAPSDSGTRGVH